MGTLLDFRFFSLEQNIGFYYTVVSRLLKLTLLQVNFIFETQDEFDHLETAPDNFLQVENSTQKNSYVDFFFFGSKKKSMVILEFNETKVNSALGQTSVTMTQEKTNIFSPTLGK